MWRIFLFIFAVMVIGYFGLGILAKYILRYRFHKRMERCQDIVLTFDDGPDDVITPQLLELLRQYHTKATFFMSGENITKYPGVARQVLDAGHEIGEHCYHHIHPWRSGPWKTMRDVLSSREVFKAYEARGKKSLYRPPYGKLNLIMLLYLLWFRPHVAFWTIDPKDFHQQAGQQVAQYVIDRIKPGSVILLHDGKRNYEAGMMVPVKALELILEEAQLRGFTFSTMREMLKKS